MSEAFKAKVRKIGNAMGVIIPKDVLKKIHVVEGDEIQVLIPISKPVRLKALKNITGRYRDAIPFTRALDDRY
jgi:putative addiction module antidote